MRLWLFICLLALLAAVRAEDFKDTFTRKGAKVKKKAEGVARHVAAKGFETAAHLAEEGTRRRLVLRDAALHDDALGAHDAT